MTTVGFVGLGDQGAPIARAIAEGGFELHVWARRPASLTVLEGLSSVAHESLTDLGVCDIVALCLREDPDAVEVAVDRGLLAAMRPGDLELPLPRLLDVLRSGSASSTALTAFGPAITVDNAEHLRTLELIDMDLFAGAVESLGDKAKEVVRQAVAGAEGLPELTRLMG